MADALLLASQRVVPKKLLAANYSFRLPSLGSALARILATTA
jgi:NAD dependent epimerase/dehydratase family enzyme